MGAQSSIEVTSVSRRRLKFLYKTDNLNGSFKEGTSHQSTEGQKNRKLKRSLSLPLKRQTSKLYGDTLSVSEKQKVRTKMKPEKSILKRNSSSMESPTSSIPAIPMITVENYDMPSDTTNHLCVTKQADEFTRLRCNENCSFPIRKISRSLSSPEVSAVKKNVSVKFQADITAKYKRKTVCFYSANVNEKQNVRKNENLLRNSQLLFDYSIEKVSKRKEGNSQSKYLAPKKIQDRPVSAIEMDTHKGHSENNTVYCRRKSTGQPKELIRERHRSLPGSLQKKFNFEKERIRRNSYSKPLTDIIDACNEPFRRLPLRIPLDSTMVIKLIPDSNILEILRSADQKHMLYLKVNLVPEKVFLKTGHLYQAAISFTEGTMANYVDPITKLPTKRLLRAQVWTGLSQIVEFDEEKLSIVGNFKSNEKGMISFLEFELVLHPNYRLLKSKDTGTELLAVGVFQFRDSRHIVREKVFRWQAVVEDTDGCSFHTGDDNKYQSNIQNLKIEDKRNGEDTMKDFQTKNRNSQPTKLNISVSVNDKVNKQN